MDDRLESVRPVSKSLDALHDAYRTTQDELSSQNGVLAANPNQELVQEFRQAWKRFEDSLRSAVLVMKNPQPGQGLVAIWLREVCSRAAAVEAAAKNSSYGWEGVLLLDNSDFYCLCWDGWRKAYQAFKWSTAADSSLSSLLETESSPLEELRKLVDQWPKEITAEADFDNLPLKEAGELIIKSIVEMALPSDVLSDEDFCKSVLFYLEVPSGLATWLLQEGSSVSFQSVLELSEPPKVEEVATQAPRKPYPLPTAYARDKWIYENMSRNTCHQLSLELKKRSEEKSGSRSILEMDLRKLLTDTHLITVFRSGASLTILPMLDAACHSFR